ncbi:MAG: hypothetical protein ACRDPK_02980 [Carbonactinosporaceae bacterium]
MRPKPGPPLLASELPADQLNLRPGERRSVVCPACQRWRFFHRYRNRERNMIAAHRAVPCTEDERIEFELRQRLGMLPPRCPGSGQRIRLDITHQQWAEQLNRLQARRARSGQHATQRRPTRVQRKPEPPVVPAVHRVRVGAC